ncbi:MULTISPECIES: NADP-dependent oxidoreductase [unclassified Modestobacter]
MRFGGPGVLEVLRVPTPHAGPGEIRVKVAYAALNPADTAIRDGASGGATLLAGRRPPYIPGMDLAGVVDEVGPAVEGFTVGDRVMAVVLASRPAGGAYAEYVVVPAASAAVVPDNVGLAEASTVTMNGLTALRALDLLGPAPEIVVTGAAGVLGSYTLQLAVRQGVRVVAIASPRDFDFLDELGAHVLIPRGDGIATRLPNVLGGTAKAVVDAACLHDELVPAIAVGGAVAAVRPWPGRIPEGMTVHEVRVSDYSKRGDLVGLLAREVSAGTLTPRVVDVVPAARAAEAHVCLERGGLRGRIVLEF